MADGDGNPRLSFRGGEIVQRRSIKVIMTATPRQVVGGETVQVTWGVTEGTADFHDWLGLFVENDPKKCLRHVYVKTNKRGGEWSVEAPRETGRYDFRFIKSLFPYDFMHKDYLDLARSNAFEVVEAGANFVDHENLGLSAAPYAGMGTAASGNPAITAGGWSPSSAAASPAHASSRIGLSPHGRAGSGLSSPPGPRSGSGHVRSGSAGSSSSLLGTQLATHAEGFVGRLPVHPLTWILRQFSSDDELARVKIDDVVELSLQVEGEVQAEIVAKRLAAAAQQPLGPGCRAVVAAGGVGALLYLATRFHDPEILKHVAHGLHSMVTHVPALHGGMHDARMYDAARRLLTFAADYPHTEPPLSPEDMVQTGLFSQPLEPGSDRVICIACGVVLEGWVKGQVPSSVHQAASPHCRFVQWPYAPAAPAAAPHLAPAAALPPSHAPKSQPPPPNQPIQGGWGQMLAQAGAVPAAKPPAAPPLPPVLSTPSPPARVSPPGRVSDWDASIAQHAQHQEQGGQRSPAAAPSPQHTAASVAGCQAADARELVCADSAVGCPSVVTWWPLGARRVGLEDAAAAHTPGGGRAVAPPSTPPAGGRDLRREESGAGVWGAAAEDEAGGVGVLEVGSGEMGLVALEGSVGSRLRPVKASVARDLLESPEAEQALLALSSCPDKQVRGWWYRLLAALAHAAGPSNEFASMCLPRLLLGITTCKDEARLVHLLEALRCLALQPRCRHYLTSGAGYDTLCALVNALPKWSARNLEVANRAGGVPSDVWPRLLENAMVVLQHTLVSLDEYDAQGNNTLQMPPGAPAAVLCVLREAPFEHAEVQRGAVACLHMLATACDPMASRPFAPSPAPAPAPASSPMPDGSVAASAQHLPAAVALGAGASPGAGVHSSGGGSGGGSSNSIVRRKTRVRDIREITTAVTVGRLVELMERELVRGCDRDLHLRTCAARLLGNLIIQRPNVCLEIAYIGISPSSGLGRPSMGSNGSEDSGRVSAYPVTGLRVEAGSGEGPGRVDGITALLRLARDTGVARGQYSAGATGSSDVLCQRMVARCIEAISNTCHMEPAVKDELLAMGFKESEVGQAMRMAGGTSKECAVTWLMAREETLGGPEDEFEMVEDAAVDLPTMLISGGGLDCMAEMLQEPDPEVQASLWKAIAELTRVGARCRKVLRSRVGQQWLLPLIAEYTRGADLMVGDRTCDGTGRPLPGGGGGQGIAGAGGSVRDSLGSCKLEVVANMAADKETCEELLPVGLVLLLASAACAARTGDTVGARTCARGLYYALSNSPDDKGEDWWHSSWWPLEPCGSGGCQALLHLCHLCQVAPGRGCDASLHRWTGMALHRLCLRACKMGVSSMLENFFASRGVQSILFLVWSPVTEVSAYAMATLAMLSALSVRIVTSRAAEPVSSVRALFLAGIMFPTNRLGRQGPLDAKLAAARILKNIASEDQTLDDMLTGNDETLALSFDFLSLVPTDKLATARRDGKLIASACHGPGRDSTWPSTLSCEQAREQALIEMKECALALLQAVCLKHKYHPRFLKLGGLAVLSALAKSEACDRHKSIARGIVQVLESLAGAPDLRQVLNDNAAKNVAKMLYKRHEDQEIEASMERILVLLQPQPLPRGGDSTAHASAGDGEGTHGHGAGGGASGWRVICQLSLACGDKDQFVFSVAETLSFAELQGRVCRKFGPSVVITFQDEHEEWKVMSGDDMLAYAMSLPHAKRKRKLHIEVVVVTPLWEQGGVDSHSSYGDPERNPRVAEDDMDNAHIVRCASDSQTTPSKEPSSTSTKTHTQLLMSRLCDSSPSFRQQGDGIEGPTMRWHLGKLIGEGAYARVFLGMNADTGEHMAIKQVTLLGGHEHEKKRLEAVSALQREIEVMKLLQHENIVKYLGTETTDDRLNIFLEYVPGGSIAQLISNFGPLEETVVRKFTRQIVVGLDFLHDKGIVHCDIKGGNILVTEDGIIKLADFNSSKQLGNIAGGGSNPLRSLLGTPQFMAPEVIRQTGHGRKADIWSVGCTVVQMLTGAPPWDEISNKITLMFHIASSKQPPSPPENISEDAKEFLRRVFQIEPRDRPSCQDVLRMPFCIDRQKSSTGGSTA